jgi:anti-sigma regulatory factor (Ser/Thr protein kinase)
VRTLDAQLVARANADQEARAAIREQLADALPAPSLYDLLTVVTELVANAVRHGEPGLIRLRVAVESDGTIRGEVENPGKGNPEPREIDAVNGSRLGLHIVDVIAYEWEAVTPDDSTLVRFVLAPLGGETGG